MKLVGILLMALGLGWAGLLAAGGEPVEAEGAAPAALLLGVGFALLTTSGVRAGSVRGSSRRIERSEQPTAFWVVVVVYYVLASAMVLFGLFSWT